MQPGAGAGARSPLWWKRTKHAWELSPNTENPRITVVGGVEYRAWVEPCTELEPGHEDECPGYVLEHTGPGGEWIKQLECTIHGYRWRREYMSVQERAQDLDARMVAAQIPWLFHDWTFYSCPPALKERAAYSALLDYASKGVISQSLLLIGPFGTGKTSLAISVVQKRVKEHKGRALFANVNALFEDIKALFGRENESSELVSRVLNVPLLVLDDLGAERATEWVQGHLYNILNHRLTSNKPTIVTTNLDYQELVEQLGARTVERLRKPYYKVVYVDGANLRDGKLTR